METAIKPKFGRVLIKRENSSKTAGGIYIPETVAKRNAACEGVVIALGETAGWADIPEKGFTQTLKVGDTVIFGRHAGAWLDSTYGAKGEDKDDGTLFICQDEDILAVKESI